MCSGGQRRIEGSPCEKIREKKSRKENNGNKQIEEESVVRKSVRQQPEDGRGRDQEESKGQWKAS